MPRNTTTQCNMLCPPCVYCCIHIFGYILSRVATKIILVSKHMHIRGWGLQWNTFNAAIYICKLYIAFINSRHNFSLICSFRVKMCMQAYILKLGNETEWHCKLGNFYSFIKLFNSLMRMPNKKWRLFSWSVGQLKNLNYQNKIGHFLAWCRNGKQGGGKKMLLLLEV